MGEIEDIIEEATWNADRRLQYVIDNPPSDHGYESLLAWTKTALELGYQSDGCTFSLDGRFRHVCKMHDLLYETEVVSRYVADNYLYRGIADHAQHHGRKYQIVAAGYWIALRFANLSGLMTLIQAFR